LYNEFGIVPTVAWLIDEFGHSSVNAELFAEMGYEALVIGRVSEHEVEKRRAEKSL
jgi:hypothetical protein